MVTILTFKLCISTLFVIMFEGRGTYLHFALCDKSCYLKFADKYLVDKMEPFCDRLKQKKSNLSKEMVNLRNRIY